MASVLDNFTSWECRGGGWGEENAQKVFSDCFYADDVTTVTSETFTEDPSKIFFYFLALTLWLEGFKMMSV